jgi:hypothetical protein
MGGALAATPLYFRFELCIQNRNHMQLDKNEFLKRFEIASENLKKYASKYFKEIIPSNNVYTLPLYNNKFGKQGPPGTIKYLGGRFLKPRDLFKVTSKRAAQILWINGKVPKWIDIFPLSIDEETINIGIMCSHRIVIADDDNLIINKNFDILTKPFYPKVHLPADWEIENGPISLNESKKKEELEYQLEEVQIECSIEDIKIPAEKVTIYSQKKLTNNHNFTCSIQGEKIRELFDFLSIGSQNNMDKKLMDKILSSTYYLWDVYYRGNKEYNLTIVNSYEYEKNKLILSGICSEISKQN